LILHVTIGYAFSDLMPQSRFLELGRFIDDSYFLKLSKDPATQKAILTTD